MKRNFLQKHNTCAVVCFRIVILLGAVLCMNMHKITTRPIFKLQGHTCSFSLNHITRNFSFHLTLLKNTLQRYIYLTQSLEILTYRVISRYQNGGSGDACGGVLISADHPVYVRCTNYIIPFIRILLSNIIWIFLKAKHTTCFKTRQCICTAVL